MDRIKFIICAYRKIGNSLHPGDKWYALNCTYYAYNRTISIIYPEGDESLYGVNDFDLFWDLPAKAGILGIVDQAQKGLF